MKYCHPAIFVYVYYRFSNIFFLLVALNISIPWQAVLSKCHLTWSELIEFVMKEGEDIFMRSKIKRYIFRSLKTGLNRPGQNRFVPEFFP